MMVGQSKVPRSLVGSLVEQLIEFNAKSATKYLSSRLVVRATRATYKADDKQIIQSDRTVSIVLTIGPPNHLEHKFIKDCKKAGESFPVRKIQFTYPRRPRKTTKKRKRGKKR